MPRLPVILSAGVGALLATAAVGGEIESRPLAPPRGEAMRFVRIEPAESGVDFENRFQWSHPRRHLYPHGWAGGGVCIGDVDDNGLPDVFLTSQTGRDRLFLQAAPWRFTDATDAAGLPDEVEWGAGATFADADGDGRLDLYVCNYEAPNRLYLNRGAGRFEDDGGRGGLDFAGASVMAAFADYDLDGDLDCYLLTNRLYPGGGLDAPRTRRVDGALVIDPADRESFAVQARRIDGREQTWIIKAGQRDRLYRNNGDGTFTDVAADAGISGNHPGLSATWWDFDGNGLPDLYVANDFWDPDRLYRNNGDGTFTDVAPSALPHTPWFSMGADFADVDNDGRLDFLAADMSATTHYMSKIMMGDMNESRWFLQSAEPRQYMRNALYLSTGTGRFMEAAYLAGLASTDWTWSVKLDDLDNDGRCDAYFTNGTANHSFDPDLTRQLRELEQAMAGAEPRQLWEAQWALYRRHPPRREANLAFRNRGDLRFEDVSAAWGLDHAGISFGAALADLDRDGDLDLVVSNVDDPAHLYRNDGAGGSRLLLRLRGSSGNTWGLGATVRVEAGGRRHVRYLAPVAGYMSADEPLVHVGLGGATSVEALSVRWPGGHVQRFTELDVDRFYTIAEPSGGGPPAPRDEPAERLFVEEAQARGLVIDAPPERPFNDYARQPLLPAKHSQPGPGIAVGDADGDGRDDVFIGGPAGRPGRLLVRDGASGRFAERRGPWLVDRTAEDTAALWLDADGDRDLDLYVAGGSVECPPGAPVLVDRLYLNDGAASFRRAPSGTLPADAISTGAVAAADFDGDGDLDLFAGGRVVPGAYPLTPRSRLLRNDGGRFADATNEVAPGLAVAGMVTAALWSDVDRDGAVDLLLAIEWGPVRLWRNESGRLVDRTAEAGLAGRTGWWNGLTGADLDGDGDIDYAVTNAGLNTKYHADPAHPAQLFYGDFDGSGRRRLVEAKPGREALLPVRGLSCSSGAMPFIREKLPTFHDFASATLPEIYAPARLEQALALSATELASGLLINQGTPGRPRLAWRPLPRPAQIAPGHGVIATDLDGDGAVDVHLVHNFYWREPETGRWDGGVSILLRGDGAGGLEPVAPDRSGLIVSGDGRGLAIFDADDDGRPDLLATQNEGPVLLFRNAREAPGLAVRLVGPPGNPTAVGALVTLDRGDGRTSTAEVYAGSGHLSQSSPTIFFGDVEAAVLRVWWPDGRRTEQQVRMGERYVLVER